MTSNQHEAITSVNKPKAILNQNIRCFLSEMFYYIYIYIYIYAFSRRFYPKRLTVHSGYTCFITMCVPWELNPQPFALLTQCSTTEPHEHFYYNTVHHITVLKGIHK